MHIPLRMVSRGRITLVSYHFKVCSLILSQVFFQDHLERGTVKIALLYAYCISPFGVLAPIFRRGQGEELYGYSVIFEFVL